MIVKYRPGSEHANAEALSRLPQCQQCEVKHPNPKIRTNVKDVGEKNNEIFCRNIISFETTMDQEKNPDLAVIIKLLKAGKVDEDEPYEIQRSCAEAHLLWSKRLKLRLRGGMLYLLVGDSQYRLLVPKGNRQELVKLTHENFAHIGIKKTSSYLAVNTIGFIWI